MYQMDICQQAECIQDEMIIFRRHLHQHPELSGQEFLTSQLIGQNLTELGIEVQQWETKSGVVGLLRGEFPGPTLAIRADIDALKIQEATGSSFASVNDGISHSCGHDIHATVLLGCAKVLSAMRSSIYGNVKFIFQPAEESLVGAQQMIQAGVLEDPAVKAIFTLHCWPELVSGTVGLKKGAFMAAADSLRITITGQAGHAAHPHKSIDPVVIAAHVITALQSIVSREVAPLESVVITIGKITGGTASNVIAPSVEMAGTVRTLNPALRAEMPKIIERIVNHTAQGMRGVAKVDYVAGTPPVINDPSLVALIERVAGETLGSDKVIYLENASMGGEDFSFYLEKVPGVMFRLGTASEDPTSRLALHNPKLTFDEKAIMTGIKVMSAALQYLQLNR